jgi:hydrogenase-4 component B
MPKTMLLFLVGAVAICGLPPLNGFVSEWLLYIGLFHTLGFNGGGGIAAAATAAVALSMIGALAVACFVKFFGAVFLGTPRGAESAHAHDPATGMVGVMAALALACAGIGVFPMLVTPVIEAAAKTWAGPQNAMGSLAGMIPLTWIAVLGIGFVALMAVLAFLLGILPRAKKIATAGTWDCGYAQPTTRMQYTGSSLAQTLVTLSNFILRPQIHWPALRSLFPGNAHFKTLVTDTVLDRLVLPLSHAAGRNAPRVRVLQQGQLHLYLLYVLIITIVLLFFWGVGV